MSAFVVDRRPVPQRGMTLMRVIPTFDPLGHSHLGFRLSFEHTAVQQFTLKRGKEALGHRIVVRVAHGAHRGHDAGFPASLAEGVARVLGGFIRLLQHFSIGGCNEERKTPRGPVWAR
jgi:hypothetical protein